MLNIMMVNGICLTLNVVVAAVIVVLMALFISFAGATIVLLILFSKLFVCVGWGLLHA